MTLSSGLILFFLWELKKQISAIVNLVMKIGLSHARAEWDVTCIMGVEYDCVPHLGLMKMGILCPYLITCVPDLTTKPFLVLLTWTYNTRPWVSLCALH